MPNLQLLLFLPKRKKPENKSVQHFIFRRTKASSEKVEFEIDHYDIHSTPYSKALSVPGIWQANFLGGGRLHRIIEKVADQKTLEDFLKENKKTKGWKYGEGWQECPNSKPLKRIRVLLSITNRSEDEERELENLSNSHKADWITGRNFIDTKGNTGVCKKVYFQWPRKEGLFNSPNLIVHEHVKEGKIPTYFRNDYTTFKDSLFGIHAPTQDIAELKQIDKFLSNEANIGLIWLKSGKVISVREGVPLMKDILSLPYPSVQLDNIEKLLLSDVTHFLANFRKEGEKSEILSPVIEEDIKSFGETYCKILNSIYDDFRPLNAIIGKDFIAYPFVLGSEPEIEIPRTLEGIEEKLKNLIDHQVSYNLWVKRIIKVYHKNVIFLYKPNQKRYWLKSIAIRDADETFNDLYKQGK